MRFSIVFPCYNESGGVRELVKQLEEFPDGYEVEFILVENGSEDNSREIFKKLEKKIETSRIKILYVDKNRGYGYGIKQGLKKAKGKYIGWMHADLQYAPIDLKKFFDYIKKYDGEKLLMKGRRQNRKAIEHFFTFGMGLYDSIIFGKWMTNVMAMPVIFNKEMVDGAISKMPDDFSIDIYTYALAQKNKYKVVHLPVKLKRRETGKSSWEHGLMSRIKQSKKMISGSIAIKKQLKEENG